MKLQVVSPCQLRNEFLIGVGFASPQFVIEMNRGEDNAQLTSQLQQQSQERNRVNPTRDRDADAIPRPQQFLPPNESEHALRQ